MVRWLTPYEVSRILGCSVPEVRGLVDDGHLHGAEILMVDSESIQHLLSVCVRDLLELRGSGIPWVEWWGGNDAGFS